jgi:ERCC4-type nuclease
MMTKLSVGDYGVQYKDGHIPPVYFERKTISDLFSTLGKGYKRFKREIIRSQENEYRLIIAIEGSYSKVLKGSKYSSIEGITVILKLHTLKWRHGVDHRFFKNREEMTDYITHTYLTLGKEHIRKTK